MSTSHIVHLRITCMVEMVIPQTIHTSNGKIEDRTITQHHLDHHIQMMISEVFTIEGQPGQAIGFITLTLMSIPIMSFTHLMLLLISCKPYKMPGKQFWRQFTIICPDRTNNNTGSNNISRNIWWNLSKCEAWMETTKNATLISCQNTISIAFSKLTRSLLLTANRSKTRSPHLTWAELTKELSIFYPFIWHSCNPGFHPFRTRSR